MTLSLLLKILSEFFSSATIIIFDVLSFNLIHDGSLKLVIAVKFIDLTVFVQS